MLELAIAGPSRAEPVTVLRLATQAPDGTGWAREFRAFAREVEIATHGNVTVKWYFGGIAGDEVEVEARMQRGQLDGTASGGVLCQRSSPTMRVIGLQGMVQTREEARHLHGRLRNEIAAEIAQRGLVLLGTPGLGPQLLFLRNAVHTLDELRQGKLWRWDIEEAAISVTRANRFHVVPLPLLQASRAYDDGAIDGFVSFPAAALAFQWYTRARYLLNLPMGFLTGCLVATQRAFERMSTEDQNVVRSAAAKAMVRVDDLMRQQDAALLGGAFQRQGMQLLPVDARMRSEYFQSTRTAREQMGEQFGPSELVRRVLSLLADFRAEHPQ